MLNEVTSAERFRTGTYEFQVGDTRYNYDSVASPRGEHGYWGVTSSTKRTPSDVTVDGFCVNRMKTYPSECIRWGKEINVYYLRDVQRIFVQYNWKNTNK